MMVLAALLACSTASAQSDKEDLAIAQSIFGKTKKAIITEHIRLSDAEQSGFWKLYDEYEEKNMAISADRLKLIEKYADTYSSLTDESAAAIAAAYLEDAGRYTELYKTYLKKFSKQIGGLRAAELIQIEVYIQTAVQAALQKQIPVIGTIKPE